MCERKAYPHKDDWTKLEGSQHHDFQGDISSEVDRLKIVIKLRT